MSEREKFLERWSRRKQEAADSAKASADKKPELEEQRSRSKEEDVDKFTLLGETKKDDTTADLKNLPPIDSIVAATDIRPFLMPGVPEELQRAALQRAWRTDPLIRDFIGLSENSWDFNNPEGLHGFGPLQMTDALKTLIERTLESRPDRSEGQIAEAPKAVTGPDEERVTNMPRGNEEVRREKSETLAQSTSANLSRERKNLAQPDVVERDPTALQQDKTDAKKNARKTKVSRGGALPK